MQIKEVIVVEGKDDTAKIKQAINADTIETNGSAISKRTLEQIRHAQQKRGVIIFTDPDYPGERIRHIIDEAIPGCKHAFLTEEQATPTKNKYHSLGIEHASDATIQQALARVYELVPGHVSDITRSDLIKYGLIGGNNAKYRREMLGEKLHIGHTNGKQLLKRLTMFQITKDTFVKAMTEILQEEK
ncbi:MAG TPA: ribonuclease M5 [Bacillota bacterium]|nr:ribonuclease M5 [Bacillota bacterium]